RPAPSEPDHSSSLPRLAPMATVFPERRHCPPDSDPRRPGPRAGRALRVSTRGGRPGDRGAGTHAEPLQLVLRRDDLVAARLDAHVMALGRLPQRADGRVLLLDVLEVVERVPLHRVLVVRADSWENTILPVGK